MSLHVGPTDVDRARPDGTPPVAPPVPPAPSSKVPDGRREGVLRRMWAALRLGGWPLGVAMAALLLLVGAVSAASGNQRAEEAEAEAAAALADAKAAEGARRDVSGDLTVARERIGEVEDEVERLEAKVVRTEQKAAQAEVDARTKVEAEMAGRQSELDARSAELDQRSAALDARDAAISQTEQRIEQNSFGNGVWEVGVDIQPGKYKTSGGIDCYWKTSDRAGDIIDNDIIDGPSTVIIEPSVFTFTSDDCGTWTLAP